MDDQQPPEALSGLPDEVGSEQGVDPRTGVGTLKPSARRQRGRASSASGSTDLSRSLIRALRGPVGGPPGSATWLFFGMSGRIARKTYWLGTLVYYLAVFGGFLIVGMLAGLGLPFAVLAVLVGVTIGAMVWASIGLAVKRWHDRDKSGWWVFIAVVPFIGQIWAFVEPGFLLGTPGPNRFGEEPLDVFARRG